MARLSEVESWIPDPNQQLPDFMTMWPMADPPMEGDQIIGEGMFEPQRQWWQLPNFIRLMVGGYGSGKTLSLVRRMISLALHNGPIPVAMVSPTYEMARETTVRTTIELLDEKIEQYGPMVEYRHIETKKRFDIRFGDRMGTLLYYGGDRPERLKGPNLAGAGIDEPFIQLYGVFQQMLARVRHPKATIREINLSGTPENLGWGYELIDGEIGKGQDVGYVRAPTKANLALSPSYLQALRASMGEKEAAAYTEGQFVNLSTGVVYYGFDPAKNIIRERMPEGAELGVGFDFNVNPMAHLVFWRIQDRIHVIYEREEPNADTQYVCDALRERFGDRLREAYPDPTGKRRQTNAPGGKSDFHYIREAGMSINARPPGQPHRRDRYNAVNAALANRRLTFDPGCMRLKRYLSSYTHEGMHKRDMESMSHLLDALGYPVEFLMPVIRRAGGTFDPDERYGR